MNKQTDILKRLFLKDIEIKVYLTLLEYGHMGSSHLSKISGIHRPRLAEVLESLLQRGFVVEVLVGKRVHYDAAAPHVIVEQAKDFLSDARHVVPELLALSYKQKNKDTVTTHYGEEGLALCFLDVVQSLKKGEVFYQINSAKDQPYVDSVVPDMYRPIRDGKELERRAITTRYVGEHKKPRLERSIRYIEDSDEVFEHNVIQFIYGTKISLLDFNSLTGTIIENAAIADFQKSIFKTLYKRLPQ
jgi:sugar-specific transcriptional regulator TrmB